MIQLHAGRTQWKWLVFLVAGILSVVSDTGHAQLKALLRAAEEAKALVKAADEVKGAANAASDTSGLARKLGKTPDHGPHKVDVFDVEGRRVTRKESFGPDEVSSPSSSSVDPVFDSFAVRETSIHERQLVDEVVSTERTLRDLVVCKTELRSTDISANLSSTDFVPNLLEHYTGRTVSQLEATLLDGLPGHIQLMERVNDTKLLTPNVTSYAELYKRIHELVASTTSVADIATSVIDSVDETKDDSRSLVEEKGSIQAFDDDPILSLLSESPHDSVMANVSSTIDLQGLLEPLKTFRDITSQRAKVFQTLCNQISQLENSEDGRELEAHDDQATEESDINLSGHDLALRDLCKKVALCLQLKEKIASSELRYTEEIDRQLSKFDEILSLPAKAELRDHAAQLLFLSGNAQKASMWFRSNDEAALARLRCQLETQWRSIPLRQRLSQRRTLTARQLLNPQIVNLRNSLVIIGHHLVVQTMFLQATQLRILDQRLKEHNAIAISLKLKAANAVKAFEKNRIKSENSE